MNFVLWEIEFNATLPVDSSEMPHHVMNLLNIAVYDSTNINYEGVSCTCRYKKQKQTLLLKSKSKDQYYIKIYNKSEQQRSKGNLKVEPKLLRVEIVFQNRLIKKLFGKERTIKTILHKNTYRVLSKEYKRIITEVVYKEYVVPCISYCTDTIFHDLMSDMKMSDIIARRKELIVDIDILRMAYKEWYLHWDVRDDSRHRIYDAKKYGLPTGVIKTLKRLIDIIS